MHPSETTVLLVAQHSLVREGLRALLRANLEWIVVGETESLADAATMAVRVRPDIVLIDTALGRAAGLALAELRAAAPDALLMSLTPGEEGGAGGLRCIAPDTGIAELRTTIEGWIGARCGQCRLRASCPRPRLEVALSRRESQVALHIAEGMSSKQIAASLGIALRTVNTYRESLARKLGGSSAAVVTRYVLERGLLG